LNSQFLKILADPKSKAALKFHKGKLFTPNSNDIIPIISGIPSFIALQDINNSDRRIAWIYDRLAFAYDASLDFGSHFGLASEAKVRNYYVKNLKPMANAKVLEIGSGTASNREFLPKNIFYLGMDASFNMLRRAQKIISKKSLSAEFVHADAHTLPISSDSIDLVLSMGTIQHLTSPVRAALEMWRIRKSGAEIHILDEISRFPAISKGNIDAGLINLAQYLFPEANSRNVGIIQDSDYFALKIS